MENSSVFTRKYFLTAGESNAEGRMPLTLVAERVIEIATQHANALGIGYAALITRNIGWVLSRMSIEMYRYPVINQEYTIDTWIESYNRMFSNRNFRISDAQGNIIGYMRTVWVAMDFEKRTMADISSFDRSAFLLGDLECPIERTPRLRIPEGESVEYSDYTFQYCDLDFNRHVNTIRYLELILNRWPLEHYDNHIIRRFDILFHHECHFGQTVRLLVCNDGDEAIAAITASGNTAVNVAIKWAPLQNSSHTE